MKRLKKFLALLLASAIVFSLAACGKAADKGSPNATNDTKAPQTEPTEVIGADPLAGTWEYRIEISEVLIKSIDSEAFQEATNRIFLPLKKCIWI